VGCQFRTCTSSIWSWLLTEEQPVVFVVDDDASVRDALADLLRSVGLGVESFGSTQEFLQSKRPDTPGCIVLDVRLPGLSGLEFQRTLIESSIHLPIIFISGHGDVGGAFGQLIWKQWGRYRAVFRRLTRRENRDHAARAIDQLEVGNEIAQLPDRFPREQRLAFDYHEHIELARRKTSRHLFILLELRACPNGTIG
jgi:CheY-like chemotaxis protein